jgi:flavin-binding protein dodecin
LLFLDKYPSWYIVTIEFISVSDYDTDKKTRGREVRRMADGRVARVTEVIAGSPKSFDDAMQAGFKRASKTLRGITGMRVLEFRVAVENDKITEYRVRMEVIFVLED